MQHLELELPKALDRSSFCRVQFSGVDKRDKGGREDSIIPPQENSALGRGMGSRIALSVYKHTNVQKYYYLVQ